MAERWKDGCTFYGDSVAYGAQLYDIFSIGNFQAGRFTGQRAFNLNNNQVRKVIDSQQTWIVSFYYKAPGTPPASQIIYRALDAGTNQLELRTDSFGHLIVTRNGTVLGTSTSTLLTSIFYHIQFKFKIDNAIGTYEVRVDGSSTAFLSGTGADTQNTGNATADGHELVYGLIGDLVIFDTSGALNNNFPGDCKITTYYATGNGATNNYTPHGAGSNYQCINEHPPDDDTTYVDDGNIGDIDLYGFGTIAAGVAILSIKHNYVNRKDDAGLRQIASVCRSGGSNFVGATKTCSSSYRIDSENYETDPNTSAVWASSVTPQFGTKVIA